MIGNFVKEPPMLVTHSVACVIGLNEALMLQQIWNSILVSGVSHEGRKWIRRSKKELERQFQFWSGRTVRRVVDSLAERGLLIKKNLNGKSFDKTLWFSIDEDVLEAVLLEAMKVTLYPEHQVQNLSPANAVLTLEKGLKAPENLESFSGHIDVAKMANGCGQNGQTSDVAKMANGCGQNGQTSDMAKLATQTVLSVKVLSVKRILCKIKTFAPLTFKEISEFFKDAGMKEKQIDLIFEKHSLQIIESEVKRFCYGIDNGAEIKNPGGWLAASFKQLATDGGLAFSLKTDKAFFASLDDTAGTGPEEASDNLPADENADEKTEAEPAAAQTEKPKRKSKRKQFDPSGFWNHVNGASTRYCEAFEQIWELYPNRKFKKESARYWNGTVKSADDMQRIARALDNYKADLMKNSWREVQVGKTWFNNWQDWEDHTEMERVSIWSYPNDYGRKPVVGQFTWLEYKKENVEIVRVWDSGYFQLKTGDQLLWK